VIKIINTKTEEIIAEIPPEKILDMIAQLWEMAGLLVDKKA
jgi:flagellar protein FlaG